MSKLAKKILAGGMCLALAAGALTGCGAANKNATVMTVDGEKVSLGMATFMLRFNQAATESYLGAMFGDQNIWEQDLTGSGVAYGTTFKAQVIDNLKDMIVLEKHMGDYQVEITDDEKAEIEAAAKQFMEENDKKVLDAMMATEENAARVMTLYTVQSKMQKAIKADVDTEVSDEEAAQKTIEYAFFTTGSKTDENGNEVERTEEEKEEIKQQAQGIIDAVNDGKTLEEAVKEVDENKSTSKMSYGDEEDSVLVEALKTAADTLKEDGEIYAEPVQTDTGVYVVQMQSMFDREATDQRKEEIITERENTLYQETLEGWEPAEYKLNEKLWEKVTFFDKFSIKQEETEAAETEAETTEAASEAETTEAASETEAETTEAASEAETTEAASEAETTEAASETESESGK